MPSAPRPSGHRADTTSTGSLFPLGGAVEKQWTFPREDGVCRAPGPEMAPWVFPGLSRVSGSVCLGPAQGVRIGKVGQGQEASGVAEGLSLPGEGFVLSTVMPSTEFVHGKKNEDTILSS